MEIRTLKPMEASILRALSTCDKPMRANELLALVGTNLHGRQLSSYMRFLKTAKYIYRDRVFEKSHYTITIAGRTALAAYEAVPTQTDVIYNGDDKARWAHDERTLDSNTIVVRSDGKGAQPDVEVMLKRIAELEAEVQRQSDGWAGEIHLRQELEANLADALAVNRVKGAELTAAIAQNNSVAEILRDTLQSHDGDWQTIVEGVKLLAHYHKQSVDVIYQIASKSRLNDMAEILEALSAFRAALEPFAKMGNAATGADQDSHELTTNEAIDDVRGFYPHAATIRDLRNAAEVYRKYKGDSDE